MISQDKTGGRTIELFVPFDHGGQAVARIVLAPFRFGHLLRWNDGEFPTSLSLLVEIAGVDEAVIRSLRYPDVERVMEAFLAMMPSELRDDIANARVPQKREGPPQEPPREPAPEEPGIPIEPGFDLGEDEP